MNQTKTLFSVYGIVLACLLIIFSWCYGVAHGTVPLDKCSGADPRVTAPYPLTECKFNPDYPFCLIRRIGKNYNARLDFNRECINTPVKKKGNN